jgi:hypothetical protein
MAHSIDDSEAGSDVRKARTCGHWRSGQCFVCGVPWQDYEVAAGFECPRWVPRGEEPTEGREVER